ncbi:MAG: methylenetetrahydrofolate reductase [NAD(P)H] [Spirochaetaceae bacterium]|nr:methylenetetrahydrofolate reductase [NAD(P)H] [Spirochaetaceae bacterium]
MKISEVIKSGKLCLSFEVFPPKTDSLYNSVEQAVKEIASLEPDFMSVTYGAGGGTSEYTVSIASGIQKNYKVPALAHITCVSSTKQAVQEQLKKIKTAGIENILALRGDIPEGMNNSCAEFQHANQLVAEIKATGDFCVGGACYPEGHPESANSTEDIINLKKKVDAGCEFLTTQMFFDNNILYNFLYKIREKGITVPIIPGIMPVTNGKQIARICKLSGTYLPARFKAIVDRFGDNPRAMTQAGIAYATDQIIDLFANGITAVHVYSMNKPEVARQIQKNLWDIIEKA